MAIGGTELWTLCCICFAAALGTAWAWSHLCKPQSSSLSSGRGILLADVAVGLCHLATCSVKPLCSPLARVNDWEGEWKVLQLQVWLFSAWLWLKESSWASRSPAGQSSVQLSKSQHRVGLLPCRNVSRAGNVSSVRSWEDPLRSSAVPWILDAGRMWKTMIFSLICFPAAATPEG